MLQDLLHGGAKASRRSSPCPKEASTCPRSRSDSTPNIDQRNRFSLLRSQRRQRLLHQPLTFETDAQLFRVVSVARQFCRRFRRRPPPPFKIPRSKSINSSGPGERHHPTAGCPPRRVVEAGLPPDLTVDIKGHFLSRFTITENSHHQPEHVWTAGIIESRQRSLVALRGARDQSSPLLFLDSLTAFHNRHTCPPRRLYEARGDSELCSHTIARKMMPPAIFSDRCTFF